MGNNSTPLTGRQPGSSPWYLQTVRTGVSLQVMDANKPAPHLSKQEELVMLLKEEHIAHRESQEMGPFVSFSARWQIGHCLTRPEMSKSS